ncbi:MAG TPA: hypothetical protein VMD48_00670 [Solirubrobacteraceae bacterium]|nr:hypothetical protein [Solirubrobacteraceae bacterium]
MRRKLIIGTALVAVLALAGVAYAATLNTYTAKLTFTASKPGTAAKPVGLGYTEDLAAANSAGSSKVAAPLIDIKTTIYGLKSNLKDFPTCSSAKIETPPKYNLNCPKGSEIATGTVNAKIGGPTLAAPGTACNPDLAIYNGGGGTEWYFFTTPNATACAGLTTGATAPYPGKVSQSGKNLVINVPLPPDVSTKVANHTNLYGSLIKETVKTALLTTKVHGKTVYSQESVACMGSKRPYSVAFTATNGSGVTQTVTVKGSAKC